jgi:hypothetical protein
MVWPDGTVADTGGIVEADPPRRLVIRWEHQAKPEIRGEGPSLCTIELETIGAAVKLSITHSMERDPSKFIEAVSGGWPKIMSNLKSLLEGGMMFHGVPPGMALPAEQADIPLIVKSSVPVSIAPRKVYQQGDVFDSVLDLFSIQAANFDRAGSFIKRDLAPATP